MSETKAGLITAAEVVTFLFAAFNSHLTGIAPPASRIGAMRADFAIGVASFAALLVFMLVKAAATTASIQRHKRIWFVVALVLTLGYVGFALSYSRSFNAYTFVYAPTDSARTTVVIGDEYTAYGQKLGENYKRAHGVWPIPAELLSSEGNEPARITLLYTTDSIVSVHNRLIYLYIGMVVVLATAIASLLELYRPRPEA
jgi:hypothetical protein